MIGKKISHYNVTEKLGAGGMGEVYRATDTKLNRDVALKVLPEEFARDADRMARFKREAQVLASLNHPNIAAIYGLEQEGDTQAIALELVEGPTLSERIRQGALPLEEALDIAKQIAEALEAAHEKGIIHRDLKPANVKVTPEGTVKVLDFGLAKALEAPMTESEIADSPTLSIAATKAGIILGTAAYMSPEQARGEEADRRADIWSFGVVLFEMLTGQRLFTGRTASDVLAAVLRAEADWDSLPQVTPQSIRKLLRRCLTRDRKQRLQAIGDARLEIDEALIAPTPGSLATAAELKIGTLWRRVLPWTLVAILAVVALLPYWQGAREKPSVPRLVYRFALSLSPNEPLALGPHSSLAISPDGGHLVYVGHHNGIEQLYLRGMHELEAMALPGTEGALSPFFSPDGQWVGFFTEDKLKKVSIRGGAPVTLCNAGTAFGASWSQDDTIIFTPSFGSGLSRISARGGEPETLTRLNLQERERQHSWPQVLPGDKAILFTISAGVSFETSWIAVQRLDTGERKILIEGATHARYLPTGHLVYVSAGTLLASPFDLARLQVTGPALPILQGVRTDRYGVAHFVVSDNGSLVYLPGRAHEAERTLVWVDRKGQARPLARTRRAFALPRLSPDGRQLAVSINEGGNYNIWVMDLARETLSRLTSGSGSNAFGVWSPDGKRIAFSSNRNGVVSLFWTDADGSGVPEQLTRADFPQLLTGWSSDGQFLAVTEIRPDSAGDVWFLPITGKRKPQPVLVTPADEYDAVFSPDGHWYAYVSHESGRGEVYVRAYPGPSGRVQVSRDGGVEPLWAPSGRELFFRQGNNKLMVVGVVSAPTLKLTSPRIVFERNFDRGPDGITNYDITANSQHFILVESEGTDESRAPLHVVLNWFEELRRLAPIN